MGGGETGGFHRTLLQFVDCMLSKWSRPGCIASASAAGGTVSSNMTKGSLVNMCARWADSTGSTPPSSSSWYVCSSTLLSRSLRRCKRMTSLGDCGCPMYLDIELYLCTRDETHTWGETAIRKTRRSNACTQHSESTLYLLLGRRRTPPPTSSGSGVTSLASPLSAGVRSSTDLEMTLHRVSVSTRWPR